MPTVDVFVPCYGYGRYLAQCVRSVLAQPGARLRVLILDDASPDETPDVARALAAEDARVSYRRHVENQGHIATYNEGLDWIRGDYALLLSADDWLLPGALARAVAVMEANPEVGFTHGGAIVLREGAPAPDEAAPIRPGWRVQSGADFLRDCRYGNPVATCAAVVRTSVQKRVGGYRPELHHSGDLEMWMRFAAHGDIGYVNADQGVYRQHSRNMSIPHNLNPVLDLRQRAAAIEHFLRCSSDRLPDADATAAMLRQGLAEAALCRATTGHDHFAETLRFAEEMDPAIRHSFAWKKQHLKRFLGPKLCAQIAALRA